MTSDRVVCAQCGANNFATQAACWKCGAALTPAVSLPTAGPGTAAVPLPVARPVDSALASPAAFWSSVVMGVLFPVIALPVGLVFLMLDDRRKAQIGWWNIIAGIVGTVLNGLLVAATLMPLLTGFSRLLPLGRGAGAPPDLNSEVSPPDLPGIPNRFTRP